MQPSKAEWTKDGFKTVAATSVPLMPHPLMGHWRPFAEMLAPKKPNSNTWDNAAWLNAVDSQVESMSAMKEAFGEAFADKVKAATPPKKVQAVQLFAEFALPGTGQTFDFPISEGMSHLTHISIACGNDGKFRLSVLGKKTS